jgi:hypothetical protein
MTWLRLTLGAVVLTAVVAGSAIAQPTNAQRADELNTQGKAAMESGDFAVASERFHQAIVLSREGRFYFNLCISLYQEGKFGESLAACNAVESAGADEPLKAKTGKMITKVRDEMKKQGFDPDAPVAPPVDPNNPPVDPNNPNNPDNPPVDPNNPNNPPVDPNNPNNPNRPVVGAPPAIGTPPTSLFKAVAPAHAYTWTLGAELMGASSSIGRFGTDAYTAPMFGFRVVGDYLIAPGPRIGAQVNIGVLHSNETDDTLGIDIIDIGIAGYKHFCGGGRFCVTPLIGASLGLLQPSELGSSSDALLSIGIRAEGRIGYALGPRYEHLLSATVGFQGYTAGFDSGDIQAVDYGLDGFSKIVVIALGYTYRFNTPFGSSPMFTLE